MENSKTLTEEMILDAIRARINGEWDNENLLLFGALSTDTVQDISFMIDIHEEGKYYRKSNRYIYQRIRRLNWITSILITLSMLMSITSIVLLLSRK